MSNFLVAAKITRPQVVALSANIHCGDVHPIELDGVELVLWRDHDGIAHVWGDRCPHRGMRLSFGIVRDNSLRCLYHGWEFARDGVCQKIPAHPALRPPPTLCAEVLTASEAMGMVIVGNANDENPDNQCEWHPVRSLFLDFPPKQAELLLFGLIGMPQQQFAGGSISKCGILSTAVQSRGDGKSAIHVSSLNPCPQFRLEIARKLVEMPRNIELKC